MTTTTDPVALHLSVALMARVQKRASGSDTTLDALVQLLVERMLDEEEADFEQRVRKAHERGMADVRAGRVISHERVVAWLKSLGTEDPLPSPRPLRPDGTEMTAQEEGLDDDEDEALDADDEPRTLRAKDAVLTPVMLRLPHELKHRIEKSAQRNLETVDEALETLVTYALDDEDDQHTARE
jgi:predicted transcriptional regulator